MRMLFTDADREDKVDSVKKYTQRIYLSGRLFQRGGVLSPVALRLRFASRIFVVRLTETWISPRQIGVSSFVGVFWVAVCGRILRRMT